MRIHRLCAVLAGVLVALAAAPAPAQTLGGVTFHGFVAQGFLKSTDNNWLTIPTEEGSFAFTEAALNFNVEPVSKLRIGGQFYARDHGAIGNNRVILDWAVGDYRFNDSLGIRAGKVKQPTGLYNIVIDNPVARPSIIMPLGMYPLSTRDISNTVQGVNVYGTVGLGGVGDLDYEAWGGTTDQDDAYIVRRFLEEGAHSALPGLGLDQPDVIVSDVETNMKFTGGGSLEWRPALPGLRLRVTATTTDADFSAAAVYSGYLQQGPVSVPVSITTRSYTNYDQDWATWISGEYRTGGLRLSAEYYAAKTTISSDVTGMPFPVPTIVDTDRPVSWYAQAAYRFNDTWQASSYYSVLYLDKDDKDGQSYVERGQPAYRAWLKQWNLAIRADINRFWLVKAEVNVFDGAAGLSLLDNPDGVTQDWTMVLLQTTVHF